MHYLSLSSRIWSKLKFLFISSLNTASFSPFHRCSVSWQRCYSSSMQLFISECEAVDQHVHKLCINLESTCPSRGQCFQPFQSIAIRRTILLCEITCSLMKNVFQWNYMFLNENVFQWNYMFLNEKCFPMKLHVP